MNKQMKITRRVASFTVAVSFITLVVCIVRIVDSFFELSEALQGTIILSVGLGVPWLFPKLHSKAIKLVERWIMLG